MNAGRLSLVGWLALGLLIGCSGAHSPSPVVGQWHCTNPASPAGDSVEIRADGTITVTLANGQSGSGTWTSNGSTFTVHGLGPSGTEDWTLANGQLTSNQTGQVCTRS